MSVLDAFIHDPLVEWEDERRKIVSGFLLTVHSASEKTAYRNVRSAHDETLSKLLWTCIT